MSKLGFCGESFFFFFFFLREYYIRRETLYTILGTPDHHGCFDCEVISICYWIEYSNWCLKRVNGPMLFLILFREYQYEIHVLTLDIWVFVSMTTR